jgi:hypothetical protein
MRPRLESRILHLLLKTFVQRSEKKEPVNPWEQRQVAKRSRLIAPPGGCLAIGTQVAIDGWSIRRLSRFPLHSRFMHGCYSAKKSRILPYQVSLKLRTSSADAADAPKVTRIIGTRQTYRSGRLFLANYGVLSPYSSPGDTEGSLSFEDFFTAFSAISATKPHQYSEPWHCRKTPALH